MEKPGIAARRTALWLLGKVTGERRALADLLPEAVERLAPGERAHAQRLACETLRWMDRADRMLGPHLRKRPGLDVLNALRLGVAEMTVCSAPPYGVVDTLVSLMRERRRTAGGAALVNAVLRRVAKELHIWETLPLPRMPGWLRRRMVSAYGASRTEAMERAHSAGAPLDITPKAGEPAELAARVGGFVLPTGSVRVPAAGQVSAMPGYGRGDWWVQDASAALPAMLLAAPARYGRREGARRHGGHSGGAAPPPPDPARRRTCSASCPAGRPRRGRDKVPSGSGARRLIRTGLRTWSCLPVCCGFNTFIIPAGRLHIQASQSEKSPFQGKTAQPRSSAKGSAVRQQVWFSYGELPFSQWPETKRHSASRIPRWPPIQRIPRKSGARAAFSGGHGACRRSRSANDSRPVARIAARRMIRERKIRGSKS